MSPADTLAARNISRYAAARCLRIHITTLSRALDDHLSVDLAVKLATLLDCDPLPWLDAQAARDVDAKRAALTSLGWKPIPLRGRKRVPVG